MPNSFNTSSNEIIAIKKWILYLMQYPNLPYEQIDPLFNIEDGMDINQYWEYEKDNFQNLSSIFDLNERFQINILYKYMLDENRNYYFIYIINAMNKIVCKMNITLSKKENDFYISSNNYLAQIVPKFGIWEGHIKEVGLAIKTKYPLKKIVSNDLELISLEEGNSFDEDSFYSARFISSNSLENNTVNFVLYMQKDGHLIKEKRQIFFDKFQKPLKPYHIDSERLKVLDEVYPVSISAIGQKMFNKAYPRGLELSTKLYSSFIVTDCLDNDWHIN